MSDDTTTWLKKNPAINPLRRSLKTSMLFHVPSSDMNASIMSNPDKVKDQGLFIPRMLQRTKMEMRKSRAHDFKVPEMVVPKPNRQKEASGSVMKKKVPTPNKSKMSFLPVPKMKPSSRNPPKGTLPRPSFFPGVSGRRTTVRRDFIKKVAEISEIKRKEAELSQLKALSGDSSVVRSILKKRASLKRTSQISVTKPKAKKVLFDDVENSEDEEKKNDASLAFAHRDDSNVPMDEPTVFLNFPKGMELEESPFEPSKILNWPAADPQTTDCDISNIKELWKSYKENLDGLQLERNCLENTMESFLQHSQNFRKQYLTYKENSEEMYQKLTKLGEELEESLRKALGENQPEASTPKRSLLGKGSEKIKMSDKSKAIKKCSWKKKSVVKGAFERGEG